MDLTVDKEYYFDKDNKLFFKFLLNNTSNVINNRIMKINVNNGNLYHMTYLTGKDIKNDYIGRVYHISDDSIYIDMSSRNNSKKKRLLLSNIFYCERGEIAVLNSNIKSFHYSGEIYTIKVESGSTISDYEIIMNNEYIISFKYNGALYTNTVCKPLMLFTEDGINYLKIDISDNYSSNIINISIIYDIKESTTTVGKSAYQISLDNGFQGTEQEWLESLKGENGESAYKIAINNGFIGTEQNWLDSLKGSNGKSAYEIACDNGFIGTEQEWLESLKGSSQSSITVDMELDSNSNNAISNSAVAKELNKKVNKGTTLNDYSISDSISVSNDTLILNAGNSVGY